MLHQRTRELRIYRHRARRRNKWRIESPLNCSHPLPKHSCDTSGAKAKVRAAIAREREIIDEWQMSHNWRLFRMEEKFALDLFGKKRK